VSEARRADPAGIAVAALLALSAAIIALDTSRLELGQTYGVGPKAMPYVIAAGLALLAIGNLALGLRGDFPARDRADGKAILLILGGLAAVIAIIGLGGGFIFAMTLLFAMTAAAFGRVNFLADLAIGFALAIVVYLMFDKLLSLSLPAGPLERLL
jgi:putative tricarboxylic transport membrane protein